MLFIVSPTSNVLCAIRPLESAFTVFFAILKVSFILAAISPCFNSSSLDIAHSELSLIPFIQISKVVFSMTLEYSIYKVTFIKTSIFPFKSALSTLFTLIELTYVFSFSIIPAFFALPMLQIIHPISRVFGSVSVDESALSMSHIVFPLSLVNITVCMCHSTLSGAFS
jgi:hypothetical protein